MPEAPDERLEALRHRLWTARDVGIAFEAAWPASVIAALKGLAPFERTSYLAVLNATRTTWEAAYELRPMTPLDEAVAVLEFFALLDDEALVLYEPVA